MNPYYPKIAFYNIMLLVMAVLGGWIFIHHDKLYPDNNTQFMMLGIWAYLWLKSWHYLEKKAEIF